MSPVHAETTESSEVVYSGRLINVRKDTVRLANGKTTEREIVMHPAVIGVVPVLDDGRIVFVRQYRKSAEQALLEIPAGGIDDGETPEEATRREMVEETGYRVGSLERLSGFFTSPGYTDEYMYLFLATDLEPGEATEENDEIEVELLSLDDALARIGSKEMADAKTQLGLLLYARSRQGT